MVAESHRGRIGITKRDAAARSIGSDSRWLRRILAQASSESESGARGGELLRPSSTGRNSTAKTIAR
jgi:hypothetical protein